MLFMVISQNHPDIRILVVCMSISFIIYLAVTHYICIPFNFRVTILPISSPSMHTNNVEWAWCAANVTNKRQQNHSKFHVILSFI